MSKLLALLLTEEEEGMIFTSVSGQKIEEIDTEPEKALAILETIEKKAKEANAKLEDAVVVFKDKQGKVKIKQTQEITPGKGARRGAFWGLLVGLLVGGPIGGLLGGLGLGAIIGKTTDRGINDKFLKKVGDALKQKSSAVMVMVADEDYDRAVTYLKSFDAEVYEADIEKDTEVALRKAAEEEKVVKAVEEELKPE